MARLMEVEVFLMDSGNLGIVVVVTFLITIPFARVLAIRIVRRSARRGGDLIAAIAFVMLVLGLVYAGTRMGAGDLAQVGAGIFWTSIAFAWAWVKICVVREPKCPILSPS
jgi:hypothetical protein